MIAVERRTSARKPVRLGALVGSRRSPVDQCEQAIVEDRSAEGICFRSGLRVQTGDSLVLYVAGRPLRAKVVWARREGITVSRRTGKPCGGVVAGCQVAPMPRRRTRIRSWSDAVSVVTNVGALAAGAGLLAAVVYWLVRIMLMLSR